MAARDRPYIVGIVYLYTALTADNGSDRGRSVAGISKSRATLS